VIFSRCVEPVVKIKSLSDCGDAFLSFTCPDCTWHKFVSAADCESCNSSMYLVSALIFVYNLCFLPVQSSRIQSPSPISVHFHVRADMFTSITRPCCSLVTWFSIPYQRISPRDLLDVKKSARYSCQRTGKHSNDPRTQLQMSRPSYLEWELEFEFGVGVEGKVYTLTPSQGRFSAICDLRFGVRSSVFVLCFMFGDWHLLMDNSDAASVACPHHVHVHVQALVHVQVRSHDSKFASLDMFLPTLGVNRSGSN